MANFPRQAFALLLLLLIPAIASAQSPELPAGEGRWVVVPALGAAFPHDDFGRSNRCSGGSRVVGGEASLTLRRNLGDHFGVEGSVGLTSPMDGGDTCTFFPSPPPPYRTGTETHTELRHGVADGRFLRTGLRGVARVSHHDSELRLALGGALAPWHRAFGPTLGAGVTFGTGPLRLLMEGEGWWPAFPKSRNTYEWFEGTVVAHEEERFLGDRDSNWSLRMGVEVRPGMLGVRDGGSPVP